MWLKKWNTDRNECSFLALCDKVYRVQRNGVHFRFHFFLFFDTFIKSGRLPCVSCCINICVLLADTAKKKKKYHESDFRDSGACVATTLFQYFFQKKKSLSFIFVWKGKHTPHIKK